MTTHDLNVAHTVNCTIQDASMNSALMSYRIFWNIVEGNK